MFNTTSTAILLLIVAAALALFASVLFFIGRKDRWLWLVKFATKSTNVNITNSDLTTQPTQTQLEPVGLIPDSLFSDTGVPMSNNNPNEEQADTFVLKDLKESIRAALAGEVTRINFDEHYDMRGFAALKTPVEHGPKRSSDVAYLESFWTAYKHTRRAYYNALEEVLRAIKEAGFATYDEYDESYYSVDLPLVWAGEVSGEDILPKDFTIFSSEETNSSFTRAVANTCLTVGGTVQVTSVETNKLVNIELFSPVLQDVFHKTQNKGRIPIEADVESLVFGMFSTRRGGKKWLTTGPFEFTVEVITSTEEKHYPVAGIFVPMLTKGLLEKVNRECPGTGNYISNMYCSSGFFNIQLNTKEGNILILSDMTTYFDMLIKKDQYTRFDQGNEDMVKGIASVFPPHPEGGVIKLRVVDHTIEWIYSTINPTRRFTT